MLTHYDVYCVLVSCAEDPDEEAYQTEGVRATETFEAQLVVECQKPNNEDEYGEEPILPSTLRQKKQEIKGNEDEVEPAPIVEHGSALCRSNTSPDVTLRGGIHEILALKVEETTKGCEEKYQGNEDRPSGNTSVKRCRVMVEVTVNGNGENDRLNPNCKKYGCSRLLRATTGVSPKYYEKHDTKDEDHGSVNAIIVQVTIPQEKCQ